MKFRDLFADKPVNTGRQNALDLGKAFPILCLPFVHTFIECTTDAGLGHGIPYLFDSIIGGPFSAPMWMFAMGIGILYTRHNAARDMIKRGLTIIGFFFLLNTCRFLIPYLIVGYDVIRKSVRNISHGDVFDENFLMMIATFGAFGIGEYREAVAVMLLYQIGELFQNYATGKSRDSISQLMELAPETVVVERGSETEEVDPDEVETGEIIVVRPGERIPLDGEVIEGESMIDTSALTGESVPRAARVGDAVISGCVNGKGLLKIRTTKCYEDSTVAKILELVENATDKKTRVENFVTRFARVYTPIVTIGALILAIIPPLVLGGGSEVWISWIRRACIFLVVSCPCALVISVPLGFFGGIGAASRIGVLVKGSNYLEVLSYVKTIVFDKTGTLTKGEFRVSSIQPAEGFAFADRQNASSAKPEEALLEMAAYAEHYSTHPVAEAIRDAYGQSADLSRIGSTEEIPGHGICAVIDGRQVLAGNAKLMRKYGVSFQENLQGGTVVYVACDGTRRRSVI